MIKRIHILVLIGLILISGLALGGYDQELGSGAVNMSMQEFTSLLQSSGAEGTSPAVPEAAGSSAVESAAYTSQPPPDTDVGELLPFDETSQSSYVYYSGSYMPWGRFSAIFPESVPVMWIRRHSGWSWYATMPLSTWSEILLFVPEASPVSIYEIYPEGFVWRYDLGYVDPGFYRIWYYADTLGRHECLLYSGNMFSNRVVVDVIYHWIPPEPSPGPSPKEICESNPQCNWVNGKCYCRGLIPEDPEKQRCEQNPMCQWVNGQCLCTGLIGSSEQSEGSMMGSTLPE
ncbi:MAG: hypothetical protein H5T42_02805 [Methanothrix sp.]|uniref:hypothetical protein n=1 Tax=Methanothrix sp. TaxID=90426 RepID=UPI00199056A7|nr:hypothetical protein [Methanothrix sp.]MBC7079391.1 hypothetical protein [Methanothrix sp.]NPU86858.1 hypothetical protein [Methanothrix sp.]